MKNKFFQTLQGLFIFTCLSTASAQTAPPAPKRMDVYLVVQKGDTTMHVGDAAWHANTNLSGTMYILLSDTINISSIHVKVGTSDGAADLLEKTFDYTQGTYNDGTSLTRKGNKVFIGLGTFTGITVFYAEANIINATGDTSPVVKYSKNYSALSSPVFK